MDGLRRRGTSNASGTGTVAAPAPAGASGASAADKAEEIAKLTDATRATIAAAFRNAGGTDLLTFVTREVRARGIETNVVPTGDDVYSVLLMTMPFDLMKDTAETLALRKRDLDGQVRAFEAAEAASFATVQEADAIFSQSEQILMLQYCLDQVKPDKKKFDDIQGNEGILAWCKRQNYLKDVFPLHHTPTAQAILDELTFKSPMFDVGGISRLQDYFGDKVALYFAFLTFYTKSLFAYGGVGVAVTLLSQIFPGRIPVLLFMFSIFATLWGAYLTSSWKRRNIEIVYMWKALIMGDSSDELLMSTAKKEDLRNEFYGNEVNHRITGEKIIVFPKRQKFMRYGISTLVVCSALFFSCYIMLKALKFEDIVHAWLDEHSSKYRWSAPFIMHGIILKNMPIAVYLAALNILDTLYNKLAVFLTQKENHKYHAEYENSLVLKLVLFQFLNMNMAYLFVAFVRRDYERLASSMQSVLLVELVVGNLKETVIPIAMSKWSNRKKAKATAERKKREAAVAAGVDPDMQSGGDALAKEKEVDLDPLSTQLEMDAYDGVFEDYFELVRQFSQITLFAAAFPLGAALAALNNCIEVKADTYKLVHMTRRASPRRALNIGAWIRAFEFLSITSIMTNLGIITVTASYAQSVVGTGVTHEEEFFWMLVIEHLLLLVRFVFMAVVEGIPSWVRDQRAKERYLASKRKKESMPKKNN